MVSIDTIGGRTVEFDRSTSFDRGRILHQQCHFGLVPLKPQLKQKLLSAPSRALRIFTPNYNNTMSYEQIHAINTYFYYTKFGMLAFILKIGLHLTF